MKQYILNPEAWYCQPMYETGFAYEIQMLRYAPYDMDTVRSSILAWDMGTPDSYRNHMNVCAEEWANSLHFGRPGIFDDPPATRQEAVARYEKALHERYIKGAEHPWLSFNGNFTHHHYAGEFGFDCICSEIGCLIKNNQMQMAFNRGAARQYRTPWMVDVSPWYDDFSMLDYSGASIWGVASGDHFGHSLSYMEREYYLSYMAGASHITAEAAGITAFYPETDEQGRYKLTPHGEICRNFFQFTKRHPDVGTPYTPFALFLDLYHGCNYGSPYKGKAFEVFPYEKGDFFTYNLMDIFFEGGCWETWGRQERGGLGSSPYGDTMDVLVQTAPQWIMNSYPVLILSGGLQMSEEEVNKVRTYVAQGGTLVMNTAYMPQLPDYAQTGDYGEGKVIVFGPDWSVHKLREIFAQLAAEYVPFTVSGKVDYMINVRENSLVLTVMNHEGVSKEYREHTIVDDSKTQTVHITLKEESPLTAVNEWVTDAVLPVSKEQDIVLHPGEVRIVEFVF